MTIGQAVKPYKAKLRFEMEDPDGNVRVYIIPHLEFGPGIYYWDGKDGRETECAIGEYSEVDYSDDPLSILKKLSSSGRDFYELKLFALMKEATMHGYTAKMFQLDPSMLTDDEKKLWEVDTSEAANT